jgi:hypothetical protein
VDLVPWNCEAGPGTDIPFALLLVLNSTDHD